MTVQPRNVTIIFYFTFALWFTAMRYSGGPWFYAWLFVSIIQEALTFANYSLFCIIITFVVHRAIRTKRFPWTDAAILGSTFIGFDLFWRFYLSPKAWDAFKLTSLYLDEASPMIVCLGITALITELRLRQRLVN